MEGKNHWRDLKGRENIGLDLRRDKVKLGVKIRPDFSTEISWLHII